MRLNSSERIGVRHWAQVFALLAGALAPCLHAQIPRPVVGASGVPVPPRAAPSPSVPVPVFDFRSGFWVNLHHFLYLQARLKQGLTAPGAVPPNLRAWDTANLAQLAPSERKVWEKAVDYYAENFAGRDFAYDSFLVRIDDRLSDMASCPDLSGRSSPACASGIDPALAAILEEAAPVYRAHWWSEQNRMNLAWISQTMMFVRQYGGAPAESLSRAFHQGWPAGPIPVDVVPYAGVFGAYTTLDPFHIVVASGNPLNQGFSSWEVVLREACFVLAEPVEAAIVERCREETKPVPRDLWHAIVFYTTAAVLERSLAGEKLPAGETLESITESNRKYIVARGWQRYQLLLEGFWQPYLDNQTSMHSAIAGMVDTF